MIRNAKLLSLVSTFLVPAVVAAQVLVVPLLSELSNAGYQMDAQIKNNLAEAIKQKNLDMFRQHLLTLRRTVNQTQTKVAGERKLAQTKMSELRRAYGSYGSDPAKWPQQARDEYNETKSVDDNLAKVQKEANDIAQRVTQTYSWARGINAATRRMQELCSDVAGFNGAVKSMKTAYAPARAGNLTVQNISKAIDFLIGGLTLKPGKSALIAMPA